MKQLILILCLVGITGFAQQKLYKEIQYQGELINLNFEDVDLIELSSSKSSSIHITMDGQMDQYSDLKWTSTNGVINIWVKETIDESPSLLEKYCRIQPLFNRFKIEIPTNAHVEINYSNGNFVNDRFDGNLVLRLETGEVNLKSIQGSVQINQYSGSIRTDSKNLAFKIQSNLGSFRTTLGDTQVKKHRNTYIGNVGKPQNKLEVKSIKANIYLFND